MKKRKIVQLSETKDDGLLAVADDGTAWEYRPNVYRSFEWVQIPPLPDAEEPRE